MLPLRDNIRSRSFPIMNWALIGINVLVFLYELSLGPAALQRFTVTYGMIPVRLNLNQPSTWLPVFTSMFLHGGWFHILTNMWVLFIFGDNVEDRMGPFNYLVFYILGGLVANLMQAFIYPTSKMPAIGASGAIAGVLGAYFLLYPRARVVTLIPIFIYSLIIEIPALVYLGFWFISQLYSGLFALSTPGGVNAGGVAWWAHVGGFAFGLVMVRGFVRHPALPNDYPNPVRQRK